MVCLPIHFDFLVLCNSPSNLHAAQDYSHDTALTTYADYHVNTVWAVSFSLAATGEIEVSFSSSGYLDVSVLQVRSYGLYIQPQVTGYILPPGCPIRKSPGHSLLAAHQGLSQPVTSFIACWRQNIPHTPLVA